MTDPRDFLLNTDYEMDKIILVETGNFIGHKDISHNLDFAPLPFGVWSTSQDFTTVNTIGAIDLGGGHPSYIPRLGVWCRSDNSKIHIAADGNGSESTTIYYRLYAFAPPDIDKDAPATSDLANKFVLNTDYNYRKILATGTFTQSDQEYAHNLGYLPQIMAWTDYRGWDPNYGIEPFMASSNYTDSKIIITNSKIKVGYVFNGAKIYWRIYYDEA
jgi:hypothetical protein